MSFKKQLFAAIGCLAILGTGVMPAIAAEMSEEEMATLENNLEVLCNESFEDLEDQGITFNETGKEYMDVACNAVVDGIDDSDFSDEEFSAAVDFLAEALATVTYSE
ncbi:hypothetical protein [Leptolyngbya ohadii]|uniref:hypothetical protein n=1 Tax=Leptolyngbya ohadii TaxID=1962290 RepID=UPI000B5A1EF1|nr:hypothetical protein [Leptolyngbya ohadii]